MADHRPKRPQGSPRARAGRPKGGRENSFGGPIIRRGTVRLPYDVARRVRAGHPWVYRDVIDPRRIDQPGALIELIEGNGEFVARGIADGETAIAIRVVTRRRNDRIDDEWVRARVDSAISLRRRLLDFDRYEAMRLINSESDGLPALALDRYGDYLVCQLYSSAALQFCQPLYDHLEKTVAPKAIYEQRRFKSLAGGSPPQSGAQLMRGDPAPVDLEVREGDLRFVVDVTAPLSTGLFCDLRSGREAISRWAKGRRVLNLFSYTGAISVYAAHGGAAEICAVDVAAKAHARSRRNLSASGFDPEMVDHITGDALKTLFRFKDRERKFDCIVIDPPSFASGSRGGRPFSAIKDYGDMVAASIDLLTPGGVLAAASSTWKMSHGDFDNALADGAAKAHAVLRIVERCGLPADYPVTPGFPEANYLKFAIAIRD